MQFLEWVWPEITSSDDAKETAKAGSTTAYVVAVIVFVTGLMAGAPLHGLFFGFLLAALGWGIRKLSRTAAVLAVAFYVLNFVLLVERHGFPDFSWIVALVIIGLFLRGLRGTFAYYVFKEKEEQESGDNAAAAGAMMNHLKN